MSYYRTCPRCGANLDPCEVCSCLDVEAGLLIAHLTEKETAHGADNTMGGRVEQSLTDAVSASNNTES